RRRHTRFSRDWSSDVCSSDLDGLAPDAWLLVGRHGFPVRGITIRYELGVDLRQVSRADVAVGWFEGDREVIEHRPAGFVPPLTTPPRRWVRPPIKDRQKADFLEFFEEGRQLRSEEHTSELQLRENLVCRLLLEK